MNTLNLPSKSNLMKLKNKIKLSKQGQDLLEKKKFILTVEKNKVKDQVINQESNIINLLKDGNIKLKEAIMDFGINKLINISKEINISNNVDIKYKTIMGVEIPSVVLNKDNLSLRTISNTNISGSNN